MAATDFQIKFDGKTSEVNVNTLVSSLVGLSAVMHDIQGKLKVDAKMEIKVKAIEKGSFLVVLGIHTPEILNALKELFTKENLTLGAAVLAALAHSINIKKHLKGDKVKSIKEEDDGQNVVIENSNGQTLVVNTKVFNLYSSTPSIDANLSKTFEAIASDEGIESFEIGDGVATNLVTVEKEDFEPMTTINADVTGKTRLILKESVTLNATKLSWEEKIKWQFIYLGNKITAGIKDEKFYETIDNGQQFAKGDSIVADLQITQHFDASVNAFVNKSYQVIAVKKHIPRAKQGDLGF